MKNFVAAVAVALAVPFSAVAAPQTTAPQPTAPHNGVTVAMVATTPKIIAASTTASPSAPSVSGDIVHGGTDETNIVYGGASDTDIVYGQ